jgi:exodeoxyribonuclease V alpha subunit
MSGTLYTLLEAGRLPPLSYYFARFVARGNALPEDSVLAQSAALVSMRNLQGDVCVDLGQFAGAPLFEADDDEPLDVPRAPPLEEWLGVLKEADWVGEPGTASPLILDGRRLFLGKYWRFEQQVASALAARMAPVEGLDPARLADGLARLFGQPPEGAVDWQKVAAVIAVTRRFAVISGGPGTGKTTTVVKVLTLLLEQAPALRVALAAPTGKAAARLTEAVARGKGRVDADPELLSRVPAEATTIHRLLGGGFDNRFRHHRDNPLLVDCLVVDEASMIDLPLMARLLEALPEQARLILLGDRDQLASVEAGNVLGDITGHGQEIRYSSEQVQFLEKTGAAPKGCLSTAVYPAPKPTRSGTAGRGTALSPAGELGRAAGPTCPADALGLLRVSYRFSADSGIGALAQAVNAGHGDAALDLLRGQGHEDITWLEAPPDALHGACLEWAVERYAGYLLQNDVVGALRLFERCRVLAALRGGPFGIGEINRLIAARLQNQGLIEGGDEYRGKPVMVTVNDYEVGLFNGDIGLLWPDATQVLRAYFLVADNALRSVSLRQLPQHDCAYALTVHKSQGSELDEVLLVLPFDRSPVLTRELIYTGITRARKRATIQGNGGSFVEGCRSRVQRTSALAEKLGWPAPGVARVINHEGHEEGEET